MVGPVVKTPSLYCRVTVGLISGWETKIPHAAWCCQKIFFEWFYVRSSISALLSEADHTLSFNHKKREKVSVTLRCVSWSWLICPEGPLCSVMGRASKSPACSESWPCFQGGDPEGGEPVSSEQCCPQVHTEQQQRAPRQRPGPFVNTSWGEWSLQISLMFSQLET